MTSRRSFLGSMAATCAFAAHGVEKVSVAAGRGLARPEGRVFDGMCGAYAAMYTPFFRMGEKTGELNEEMIERLVEYAVRKGLRGLYLTGATGECLLLSPSERRRVFARAVQAAKGRLKLIAHVGCTNTSEACVLARAAADAGVDWVSSMTPVFLGQTHQMTYAYYKAVSEATDLPFLIYARKGNLVPDEAVRFFDLKNVYGMKYTGYEYFQLAALRRKLPKPAIFFAGADEQELNALATGEYSGVIGSTDNQMPAHHAELCRLADEGRFLEARGLQDDVRRFVELLLSDPNWSTHKSVMRYLGLDCGDGRGPAGRPLTAAEYDAYIVQVESLGIFRKNDANI